MKMSKKTKIIIGVIILLFVVIVALFIPTGDDLYWGGTHGINQLKKFFWGYNGRYLGNLIVLLLTRSNILRIIVVSATCIGIIYMINKLINNKSKITLYLSILLFLCIPYVVLKQSLPWTSGFVNYVLPMLGLLIAIYVFDNAEKYNDNKRARTLVLILGICNALFVEHITIFSILLPIIYLIYHYVKTKKVSKICVQYLIGAAIGAFIMFSNWAYLRIADGEDSYRRLMLNDIFASANDRVLPTMFIFNVVLNTVIGAFMTIFYKTHVPKTKISFLAIIALLFAAINAVYYAEYFFDYVDLIPSIILAGIFYLAIIYLVIVSKLEKDSKVKILFYLLCAFILTGPLVFVSPIGGRNFFPIYLFQILFILELMKHLTIKKEINYLLLVLVFAQMFNLIWIYGTNKYYFEKRIDYMQEQIKEDKEEIQMLELPYPDYIHYANWEAWQYKRFGYYYFPYYKIPKDKVLIPITIKDYLGK